MKTIKRTNQQYAIKETNNKKMLLLFLSVVLVLGMLFTACEGPAGPQGPQGPEGAVGPSGRPAKMAA